MAAYGAILPKDVLDLPPFGCLNVHGSLLPRWRGAAPIERAILAGDEEIGVCIMAMEEGLDTGDYCVCRSLPAGSRTAAELTEELAALGASALLTALAQAEGGNLRWVAQDEALVTYAEKIAKGELNLDPAESAVANDRRVRASGAAHPARAVVAGRPLTVLAARVADDAPADRLGSGAAALIANRLLLGCAEGVLEVTEVKPDGKRAMDARSFAAGVPALRGEEEHISCTIIDPTTRDDPTTGEPGPSQRQRRRAAEPRAAPRQQVRRLPQGRQARWVPQRQQAGWLPQG